MKPNLITPAEIAAYNQGVEAVLAIAHRTAGSIAAAGKRHNHEDFAVVALAELADAGRALLILPGSAT